MAAADVEAYAPFRQLGVVLEVVRFPFGAPVQELLVDAIRHLAEGYDKRLRGLNGGQIPERVFRIKIREEKCPPVPMPITFQELWGSGYSIELDEVNIYRYSAGGCSSAAEPGLARALLNPPYGLRKGITEKFGSPEYAERDRAWMRALVHRFCAEVLGISDLRSTSHLKIHEWSTDWSNYFDAGMEWWGSFCWTIEDPKQQWTTAILASATD